ncbi:hypothetical protein H8356DRAFT_1308017 [Neocallimastix lanati (nom. inval.)]|nr:hypothetical protein H8356DRAFT_1308017 [Neocallimastix sp. JGI-2020a]
MTQNDSLENQRQYFIENKAQASYFDWLRSKGTSYSCYKEFNEHMDSEYKITDELNIYQTIIYIIHTPMKFTFFYWTIVVFILHKFNFKKTVMKILLLHFVLRSIGDILNEIGNLFNNYFSVDKFGNCSYYSYSVEQHPLKWFVTRQVASLFWYGGEIFADWYPLIRIKAITKSYKYIKYVYITCGLYNLSKIALCLLNFGLRPSDLYDSKGVYNEEYIQSFYYIYWIFQLIKFYTLFIYEIAIYFTMKKSLKELDVDKSDIGFLKKFKNLSEYRMLSLAIFSALFLPIITLTVVLKFTVFKKKGYNGIDFSLEEFRFKVWE